MKIKIISEPSSEKLQESVNAFLEEYAGNEILSIDIKSFSNHEYWLNNNPVTIAQSWVEYICVITYKKSNPLKFCCPECEQTYKDRKQMCKTEFCDNCEAPIENNAPIQ